LHIVNLFEIRIVTDTYLVVGASARSAIYEFGEPSVTKLRNRTKPNVATVPVSVYDVRL